jgi:hypothetical protein
MPAGSPGEQPGDVPSGAAHAPGGYRQQPWWRNVHAAGTASGQPGTAATPRGPVHRGGDEPGGSATAGRAPGAGCPAAPGLTADCPLSGQACHVARLVGPSICWASDTTFQGSGVATRPCIEVAPSDEVRHPEQLVFRLSGEVDSQVCGDPSCAAQAVAGALVELVAATARLDLDPFDPLCPLQTRQQRCLQSAPRCCLPPYRPRPAACIDRLGSLPRDFPILNGGHRARQRRTLASGQPGCNLFRTCTSTFQ